MNSFAAALSQALSIDKVRYTKMVENVSRIDLSFVATPKYIDLLDSLEGETNK